MKLVYRPEFQIRKVTISGEGPRQLGHHKITWGLLQLVEAKKLNADVIKISNNSIRSALGMNPDHRVTFKTTEDGVKRKVSELIPHSEFKALFNGVVNVANDASTAFSKIVEKALPLKK